MNIHISTDHNIEGSAELNNYIKENLSATLERFKNHITRIEVHLSDENGGKSGGMDKRCLMEARLAHHNPIIIHHNANGIHEVIHESASKLLRSIIHTIDKATVKTGLNGFNIQEEEEDNQDSET